MTIIVRNALVHHPLLLAAASILPLIVQAQTPQKALALEEVIVTAEHRSASIQDTQISMNAFSDEMVRELGISNAADLGQFTPNVTISEIGAGRSGVSVNMRGVRQGESHVTFDPAVGMYFDGVLVAKSTGSLLDIVDIERIEVLRGPQGTLYGRNTIGGAINIVTKKPEDVLTGRLDVTLGSENQRDYRGVLNVPLADVESPIGGLYLRAGVGFLNRDGFYKNEKPGSPIKEMDTVDRDVATVKLRWVPSDNWDIIYSYDRTRVDENPRPDFYTYLNPNFPLSAAAMPSLVDHDKFPDSGYFGDIQTGELEVDGHSLNVTYEISDNLSLQSISAYREMWNRAEISPGRIFIFSGDDTQENETTTQEFRLLGDAFDGALQFTSGAYFLRETGSVDAGVSLGLLGGIRIPTYAEYENKAWAVYGQGTYYLADSWHLTAGLRYTYEDREMTKPGLGTANGDFNNVSPMVSIGYDWSEDVLTYAKVSRGYQSGGFNSRDTNPDIFKEGFDEELLTAYELGLKSTFGDGRYRFNIAAFFSDYEDKQVSVLKNVSDNVLNNAGAVEIYGLELDFHAQLTETLGFGFDYGYIKPKYKEWTSGGRDMTDSNFPYTPSNNGHAYLVYEIPTAKFGNLSARIDYSYQGAVTFLTNNPEINSASSYSLWNGRVTLNDLAGPVGTTVRASLWMKNILDEVYWDYGIDQYNSPILGFASNTYGDPRTFGVDFSIEF